MKYLWVAMASLMIASCTTLEAPSSPTGKPKQQIIYTNDAWMEEQDAKFIFCWQRMETLEGVDYCLIKLGVYI